LKSAPHVETRASIAGKLGEINGDKKVVDALAEALYDHEHPKEEPISAGSWTDLIRQSIRSRPTQSIVHQAAVKSLTKIGDPQAIEALIIYERDRCPIFSMKFEESIKSMGPPAVDALINLLRSSNIDHMVGAIQLLGFSGNTRAVDPLIELLQHENQRVRRFSANSLGYIGDPRAVEPLNLLLNDEDEKVREDANESLEKITRKSRF
jgi:HEAT repeat protein